MPGRKRYGVRRSLRIIAKRKKLLPPASWQILPQAVKFQVFSSLKAKDLVKFALSSKASSKDVLEYIKSSTGSDHIRNELLLPGRNCVLNNKESQVVKDMKLFGFLLRAVTLFLPTRSKILVAHEIIFILEWTWKPENATQITDAYFFHFGAFAATFVRGWNKEDLLYGHKYLQKASGMDKLVNSTVQLEPGRFASKERMIRQYYQLVYLNVCDRKVQQFWLGTIIRQMPYVLQARIMYILFGPVTPGMFVDWAAPLVNTHPLMAYDLTRLASVTMLLSEDKRFTQDDIVTIVEEMIALPSAWHSFHATHYLISCGESMLTVYMKNHLVNGRYRELCILLFQSSAVLSRQGKSLSAVIRPLALALTPSSDMTLDLSSFVEYVPLFLSRILNAAVEGWIYDVPVSEKTAAVVELLKIILGQKDYLANAFDSERSIICPLCYFGEDR